MASICLEEANIMAEKALATTKGRTFALAALAERRERSAKTGKIDNLSLYAGSPMYYYCKSCGGLADTLPECHISTPKSLCDECRALKDLEWLE
jgi:NAD-dependent SIR2 family protein deacetylase